MSKKKEYTLRVYTTSIGSDTVRRHVVVERRVFWNKISPPAYLRHLADSLPNNHGFDQTRKTKIVRGKKNVWPLPKSKGNRF